LQSTELFKEISVKKLQIDQEDIFGIIKLGNRQGVPMAMVEFVDYNEIYNLMELKLKKTTRRGRSKKEADDAQVERKPTAEKKVRENKNEILNHIKGITFRCSLFYYI
jgi:large subunit ribosomal protein L17